MTEKTKITGKTALYYVNGNGTVAKTRVLGKNFNRLLRRARKSGVAVSFSDAAGKVIKTASHSWEKIAVLVRKGESVEV